MVNRIIAITDIHGQYNKLKQLLSAVNLDQSNDRLVCLGDVIDRSSVAGQLKCIDYLLDVEEKMGNRFTWLLGNHEYVLIENYRMLNKKNTLIYMAEEQKKVAWRISSRNFPLFIKMDGIIFAHAGYRKENDDREFYIMDSSVIRGKRTNQTELVIVGHKVVDDPIYIDGEGVKHRLGNGLLPEAGTVFFDTGCAYGGKLTALIIQDGYVEVQQYGE